MCRVGRTLPALPLLHNLNLLSLPPRTCPPWVDKLRYRCVVVMNTNVISTSFDFLDSPLFSRTRSCYFQTLIEGRIPARCCHMTRAARTLGT